jgi:hypothetical protein
MKTFINAAIETVNTPTDEKLLETILKTLEKHAVYVGIPEDKGEREFVMPQSSVLLLRNLQLGGQINNATLLYIHTHGSAVMNIPARPVIEPAIEDKENKYKLDSLFLKAALEGIKGNEFGLLQQLGRIGKTAQNICRDWFINPKNGWTPNQPATVKRKLKKFSKKKRKEAWAAYQAGEEINGEPVDRPLIDTGNLRKSIIYVVK